MVKPTWCLRLRGEKHQVDATVEVVRAACEKRRDVSMSRRRSERRMQKGEKKKKKTHSPNSREKDKEEDPCKKKKSGVLLWEGAKLVLLDGKEKVRSP